MDIWCINQSFLKKFFALTNEALLFKCYNFFLVFDTHSSDSRSDCFVCACVTEWNMQECMPSTKGTRPCTLRWYSSSSSLLLLPSSSWFSGNKDMLNHIMWVTLPYSLLSVVICVFILTQLPVNITGVLLCRVAYKKVDRQMIATHLNQSTWLTGNVAWGWGFFLFFFYQNQNFLLTHMLLNWWGRVISVFRTIFSCLIV